MAMRAMALPSKLGAMLWKANHGSLLAGLRLPAAALLLDSIIHLKLLCSELHAIEVCMLLRGLSEMCLELLPRDPSIVVRVQVREGVPEGIETGLLDQLSEGIVLNQTMLVLVSIQLCSQLVLADCAIVVSIDAVEEALQLPQYPLGRR